MTNVTDFCDLWHLWHDSYNCTSKFDDQTQPGYGVTCDSITLWYETKMVCYQIEHLLHIQSGHMMSPGVSCGVWLKRASSWGMILRWSGEMILRWSWDDPDRWSLGDPERRSWQRNSNFLWPPRQPLQPALRMQHIRSSEIALCRISSTPYIQILEEIMGVQSARLEDLPHRIQILKVIMWEQWARLEELPRHCI